MTLPDLPEPRLLQLFDRLYDTRSVTRTAEQLGQSQPTVSIWLGRLREQLGDPLFVRVPGGMAPTPRADALIQPCREILESLRRLPTWQPGFDPATTQRRLRIGMTDASHVTLLPRLLADVRTSAPQLRLEAARIDAGTGTALETGELDLAIGHIPWLAGGIYQQQLFEQDWICLASADHPRLGDGQPLDAIRYRAEGHVQVAAGTGAHLLDQALARERIARRIVLELPGFLGLGAILDGTDLIATLPRHIGTTLARSHGLRVHDCPFEVERFAVRQHWHARHHQDEGSRWLRARVMALFSAP